jgi:hypothetical protein
MFSSLGLRQNNFAKCARLFVLSLSKDGRKIYREVIYYHDLNVKISDLTILTLNYSILNKNQNVKLHISN